MKASSIYTYRSSGNSSAAKRVKKLSEALQPLRFLEQIANALPGQLAYWDKNLVCRYANRAYLDWFSQSFETIIGIRMRDLLGAQLFDLNKAPIAGVLRGEPQIFVRPISRLDGVLAKVQVNYVPDWDADGNVAGFYVSVTDVTAFKSVEEQLLEKEAELTALVERRDEAISWLKIAEEIAHVGHWRFDLSSGELTWSDEMYRIHGVTPEDYTPHFDTALTFYCLEDRARVQVLMQRAASQGEPFEDMGRLVRRDGDVRYVRTRCMANEGSNGPPSKIFVVFVDVTDQQKTEQALRVANHRLADIARLDGLTGIDNRRRFDETFGLEWQQATQTGTSLSVVLIDIDHFKAFNDTYGHPAGDECLRTVAKTLRSVVRFPRDSVARYGGEEFILLLPETERAAATLVAARARAANEALGKRHEGSAFGLVTIRVGVGSIRLVSSGTFVQNQLIEEADAMLYQAKKSGRNTVAFKLHGMTRVQQQNLS